MAGEARLVGKVELCPNDAAITGKGKREAFAAASWRMLELKVRLKGEGGVLLYEECSTPCRTLIYLTSHQPGLLIVAAISRRHAVRGDYDYTSLRHLRSHFCTMHALGRAVRAARCVSIGTLYESCPLSELWERVFICLVRCARARSWNCHPLNLPRSHIFSRDALNCCRFVLPTMCPSTSALHWHCTRTVSLLP